MLYTHIRIKPAPGATEVFEWSLTRRVSTFRPQWVLGDFYNQLSKGNWLSKPFDTLNYHQFITDHTTNYLTYIDGMFVINTIFFYQC